jgi:hypothetical protein
VPRLVARWNPSRDLWETDQGNLFSELSDVFSETWPSSGMTLRGQAYELPTSALHMAGSGSSSSRGLPTPRASSSGGSNTETVALLATPTANLGTNGGSQHPAKRIAGGHQPTLQDQIDHL